MQFGHPNPVKKLQKKFGKYSAINFSRIKAVLASIAVVANRVSGHRKGCGGGSCCLQPWQSSRSPEDRGRREGGRELVPGGSDCSVSLSACGCCPPERDRRCH